MINMMRGMTAVFVMAACAPVAGQTTPKTTPKPVAPIDRSKVKFEFGRAKGDAVMAVSQVTQKEPFKLSWRFGRNTGEGGFLGVEEPAPRDTIAVRTFALRYLDSEDAAKLVGPYVRSPGSAVYNAGSRASAITIREQPNILATIDSVLREFDRPPSSVVLHFQLLTSSDTPTNDPAIRDIDAALRGLFRFSGYRVIAEGTTIASDFSDFTVTMSGESDRFIVSGMVGRVKVGTSPNVKLEVDLKAAPRPRTPTDSIGASGMLVDMMMGSQVISSGITMPLGEAIVLGSGSIVNQKGTLILVVRPSLRPALPR
jgi:hypothetical protein